jgi:hypothetical protein
MAGTSFTREQFPSPVPLLKQTRTDLVVPMSIDRAQAPWRDELLATRTPIFGTTGVRGTEPVGGRKVPGAASRALRHQESAVLADESDAHHYLRDD